MIAVSAPATIIERSDSIGPNSINLAYFKEKFFRFIYFSSVNPEVLCHGCLDSDIHIQSTWDESLTRGSFEDFGKIIHSPGEMFTPRAFPSLANAPLKKYHDASP